MLKIIISMILTSFFFIVSQAQKPFLIPSGDPEPVEFTPLNIILYIVIPIFLLIAYIFYRKSKRKK